MKQYRNEAERLVYAVWECKEKGLYEEAAEYQRQLEAIWARNDAARKNEKPLYRNYREFLNDYETEDCSCSALCD